MFLIQMEEKWFDQALNTWKFDVIPSDTLSIFCLARIVTEILKEREEENANDVKTLNGMLFLELANSVKTFSQFFIFILTRHFKFSRSLPWID